MNDPVAQNLDPLSLSAERRVDEVCIRFENALQVGQLASPLHVGQLVKIEDYLGDATEPERSVLLRELIRLEVEYRFRRGEQPTIDEYRSRFPMHAAVMASWYPAEPTVGCEVTLETTSKWPDLPGYEIVAKLGEGGMGVVYRAHQKSLDRFVALKVIREGGHLSREGVARFRSEAQAVARLQHANIVHVHDVGKQHDGSPYFTMEYIDGGNLETRLKGSPYSDNEAAKLVMVLAHAIHYVHDHDIVHRDLKPANILLTTKGEPKIADFGLAKLVSEDKTATRTNAVLGTPSYMAPEQALGRIKEIGPAADIYALGAILYQLLTGRRPVPAVEWMVDEAHDSPRVHNLRVDPSLASICLKCLKKETEDRYRSANALADDLAKFLCGERPDAHQGTISGIIETVIKETRYTEVMELWSGIWMGLAINAFIVAICQSLLLWYGVQDYAPYTALWLFKMFGDLALAWLLRIRGGPPPLPVERQLVQVWVFFWASHFLVAWLYQKSGAPVAGFVPITDMEMAVVLGSMAAILGGSFYLSAALCVVKALLDALWPGAGGLFAAVVICPYFFWLGWKYSRPVRQR